jgi:hypothetical protein
MLLLSLGGVAQPGEESSTAAGVPAALLRAQKYVNDEPKHAPRELLSTSHKRASLQALGPLMQSITV